MITAYSSVVHMPPGIYQIADVIKDKIHPYRSGKPALPYRLKRPMSRKERALWIRRLVDRADENDEYIRRFNGY